MKKAQAYIYRNLHKDCFSVRFLGVVVEHITEAIVFAGDFKVNEKGRKRVISEQQKNVHAFVTANGELHPFVESEWEGWNKREVTYNPYKYDSFVYKDTEKPVKGHIIVMDYPKVYVLEAY